MTLGKLASNIGKGLLAGLVGTIAITLSQMIEMQITKRKESSAPADAAGKVLGVAPTGEDEKKRFSTLVHFGYGTLWGAARGLMASAGVKGAPATTLHFAEVWGSALVMLPALDVAPAVTEQENTQVAIDAVHHLVYAIAVNAAYEHLDKG